MSLKYNPLTQKIQMIPETFFSGLDHLFPEKI